MDDHAVPATSPLLFDSCRVVIAPEARPVDRRVSSMGVVFMYAPGVVCTFTLPG